MILPKESLKRLARKAGILYIPKSSYDIIRQIIYNKVISILLELNNIINYQNRNIITKNDLEMLHLMNNYLNTNHNNQNKTILNNLWCDGHISQCTCKDGIYNCGTYNQYEYGTKLKKKYYKKSYDST